METHGSKVLEQLVADHPEFLESTHAQHGDATAVVKPEHLLDAMRFLRDTAELEFNMLMDLTAVDYLGRDPRFEVVYHLYSLSRNHRLRVKVGVSRSEGNGHEFVAPSVVEVWPTANWLEREVWDLYGIHFQGHRDLRRLLLYEEFQGHPLRKDYPKEKRQPLTGPRN